MVKSCLEHISKLILIGKSLANYLYMYVFYVCFLCMHAKYVFYEKEKEKDKKKVKGKRKRSGKGKWVKGILDKEKGILGKEKEYGKGKTEHGKVESRNPYQK